jgi:GMP synthase-like glutamine amidotransferase
MDSDEKRTMSTTASNAYEDIPWINQLVSFSTELVHSYLHLKLLGICFGHQIFARALGAQVIRNPLGWEFGIYEVQLSLLGQTLFQDADSPAPNLLVNLYSMFPILFMEFTDTRYPNQ